MTQIILIRHAQTDGNRQRFVGREDLPLNEVGRLQSERLAATLQPLVIDRIYTSPLARATATARPLANAKSLPLIVRPELIEIDFGALQGGSKGATPMSIRRHYRYARSCPVAWCNLCSPALA